MSEQILPPLFKTDINKFFNYILTDSKGAIGTLWNKENINKKNTKDIFKCIDYFLKITPEEFKDLYDDFKFDNEQNKNITWLYGKNDNDILIQINGMYKELNNPESSDTRPTIFRFALLFWLYVWH
jgi:hypothetical protein